ncbi:enoyl-CoA delta isomerase 1, mitochondrial-like [Lutzomyia longipalpis]|uniref:enoyl-CoA delta isomerase 1, mitochondrial-like n=1 Tax=Lutzomyia longipalpis TaxID=7200 RepID=UPI0024843DC3|nr:enoyl-CoA delta isomerase 1, mitochondrial-like [Lutzomyia longipalpis]
MFLPIVRRFPPLLLRGSNRFASTGFVKTEVDDKTGIAVVSMNRPRVNSLNLDLLRDMSSALDAVEKNKYSGMILTSSFETVFCAGLDITVMHRPEEAAFREFWTTFQDVWVKLFNSSFPTAAAINGHAPAGGCLLAMSCEYRVMRPNFTIGLNETQVGIVSPLWVMATMNNVLPRREAEMANTLGTMFKTEEALKIGLIDEIADTREEAIAKCTKFLQLFAKVPKTARALTKQSFRRKYFETLDREPDFWAFFNHIRKPEIQKHLDMYMEKLKKK